MKVAFYIHSGDTLLEKLINYSVRFWTQSKYSHTELIDDRAGYDDPSTWIWHSADSYQNRVRAENIKFVPEHWEVYDVVVKTGFQKVMADNAYGITDTWIGAKYDYLGILLSQFIPMNVHSKTRWFCSELCHALLKHSYVIHDTIPSNLVSPRRLFEILSDEGVIEPCH